MEKSLAFYGSLLGGTSYAAYAEANSAAIEAASETFELTLESEAAETNAAYKGSTTSPDLYSPALKLDWNYTAYLPASYDADNTNQAYPVIYLLHGAYGNHTNMQERFSTSDIMNELIGAGKMPEAIVVFVDGFNSYYVDGPAFAMETALIEDLIPFIENKYHGMGTKEGRIIGGISMGGYGAARYAMKYPEYFSAALLLSPAVWENATGTGSVSGWHIFVDENNQFSQEAWAANHPLVYKDSYIAANSPVNFYIVHGDKDTTVLPAAVSAFYEELNEFAPATYVNYAGGTHAWTTWAATARMALEYAGSLLLNAAE
jgi:enterochelin esterase-like enzyme